MKWTCMTPSSPGAGQQCPVAQCSPRPCVAFGRRGWRRRRPALRPWQAASCVQACETSISPPDSEPEEQLGVPPHLLPQHVAVGGARRQGCLASGRRRRPHLGARCRSAGQSHWEEPAVRESTRQVCLAARYLEGKICTPKTARACLPTPPWSCACCACRSLWTAMHALHCSGASRRRGGTRRGCRACGRWCAAASSGAYPFSRWAPLRCRPAASVAGCGSPLLLACPAALPHACPPARLQPSNSWPSPPAVVPHPPSSGHSAPLSPPPRLHQQTHPPPALPPGHSPPSIPTPRSMLFPPRTGSASRQRLPFCSPSWSGCWRGSCRSFASKACGCG